MKGFRKILAICMTTVMLVASSVVAVSAANYTAVAGEDVTFNKYLVVDEDAKIPAITFEYSIAPGTAIPASNGVMEVLAGPTGTATVSGQSVTTPYIDDAVFTEGESKYTSAQTGDEVTLSSGQNYAKKTPTIHFDGVTFPEPGIYRYVVTETSAGQQGISYDTQAATPGAKVRYLDVYVVDNNGTLEIDSQVFHENASTINAGTNNGSEVETTVADKSDGYVNSFATKNLSFAKEVTGNQGSKDKYFDFTLQITGAQPNMTYVVDITGAEATSGSNASTISANTGQTNATTITVNNSGNATTHFYLKHGQYVTVKGLPEGTSYTLTENAEDYKSTAGTTNVTHGNSAYNDSTNGTISSSDIYTGYTNTRQGVIPTGVILTVAPFMIGMLLFGALALFLVSRRRREAY